MVNGSHRGWLKVRLVRGATLLLAVSLVSANLALGQPQGKPLPPGIPAPGTEPASPAPLVPIQPPPSTVPLGGPPAPTSPVQE